MPIYYVATYGEGDPEESIRDNLLNVELFTSKEAYEKACEEAEALHDSDLIDAWTAGEYVP